MEGVGYTCRDCVVVHKVSVLCLNDVGSVLHSDYSMYAQICGVCVCVHACASVCVCVHVTVWGRICIRSMTPELHVLNVHPVYRRWYVVSYL